MKYFMLSILALVLMLPAGSKAQSPSDKVFEKHAVVEGVTSVSVPGFLLGYYLMSNFAIPEKEVEKYGKYIESIQNVSVLTTNSSTSKAYNNLKNDAAKLLADKQYVLLTEINKSGNGVKVMSLKGSGSEIKEIIGYVKANNQAALFSAKGDFTEQMMKDILKMVNEQLK